MKYTPVVGLEVHVELSTNSKLFCGCSADHFAKEPNTNVCPVCMGLPGALPYTNIEAVRDTIMFGLALNCKINNFSKFDRKHYFYPDLPKAYQISQYDLPFCESGKWTVESGKTIGITRVHLEEDTGKLVHKNINEQKVSLIDFNRSSVPLMELVTEPDFDNVEDVLEFLKELRLIVRYLGISTADMEKGSMRLEANISLRKSDEKTLPNYKIELKNINSFKFLEKALKCEIERQSELLSDGNTILQETRGYDEAKGMTFSQRSKEDAHDYRYFPEPDIPPLKFTDQEIIEIKSHIPELPNQKRDRFKSEFKFPDEFLNYLVSSRETAEYFEKAVQLDVNNDIGPKTIASSMVNLKLHEEYPEASGLIRHLKEITKTKFSNSDETNKAIDEVISKNPKQVQDYQNGKEQLIGFFIGQVQKILQGGGDSVLIRNTLISKLGSENNVS